jgi:hypothetical protein
MDSCRLSPKTDSKEKIKANVLIGQYYKEKLHLIRNEPSLVEQMKRIEPMKPWSSYQTGGPSWTVYDWVSSKCQRRIGLYEDMFFRLTMDLQELTCQVGPF